MRHFRARKDGAPLLTSTLSTFHTSPEGHCLFSFLVNPFIWCSAFIHQVIGNTREKVLLILKSAHQTSHQIGNTLNISIRSNTTQWRWTTKLVGWIYFYSWQKTTSIRKKIIIRINDKNLGFSKISLWKKDCYCKCCFLIEPIRKIIHY